MHLGTLACRSGPVLAGPALAEAGGHTGRSQVLATAPLELDY